MAIGDYYKNITLRKVTETVDDSGGAVLTYVDSTIAGVLTQLSSAEAEIANKLSIMATHMLYCEADADITNKDRIVFGGIEYQVVSEPLNTLGRNHHLRVMVKRVIND